MSGVNIDELNNQFILQLEGENDKNYQNKIWNEL